MSARFNRLSDRARLVRERLVKRALDAVDIIPGARRVVTELARVEVIDRALALGAQALLALFPLLMIVSAFTPPVFGTTIVSEVRESMGISDDLLEPVRQLTINRGQVQASTGLFSIVVTFFSATAFCSAMQRTYTRVWDLTGPRPKGAIRWRLVWLVGWMAYLQAIALMVRSLVGFPGSGLLTLGLQLAGQLFVWWWTARLMLLYRVSWSMLLPAGVLTGVGMLALTYGSSAFMPRYVRTNVEQFGSLGLVFAAASWLVLFGGVVVVANLLGRLTAESRFWRMALDTYDRFVARRSSNEQSKE